MLHDAPNLGSKKYMAAADLLTNFVQKRLEQEFSIAAKKIVIAISGESGSGKTSIAYQFCKQLMARFNNVGKSLSIKHLHVDNFYLDNYRMENPASRDERIKSNDFTGIGPDQYDWQMIDNILHCFRNGYDCRMPCVDVLNHQIDHLESNFSEVDILLLDGLFAIDAKMKTDYRFFVAGPYFEINNWGAIRKKYFDSLGVTEELVKYANEVVEFSSSDLQDIRGKEKLSKARVICLEKEHEAMQNMLDSIKTEAYEFYVLQYAKDTWKIDIGIQANE